MNIAFENFFDNAFMIICDISTNSIIDVNKNFLDISGYQKKDLVGKDISPFLYRVASDKLTFKKHLDSKHDAYWLFKTKNGEPLYISLTSQNFYYQNTPAILMLLHDNTKEIVNQSYNEEQLTRPLHLPKTPILEVNWDGNLRILKWQRNAELKFGWSLEEVRQEENVFKKIIYPDDIAFVKRRIARAIKEKNEFVLIRNRNVDKQGNIIYCRWYNYLYYNEDGSLKLMLSTVEDITKLYDMRFKLKKSFSSYIDMINSVNDAIYLLDEHGIILETNKGFKKLFGYEQDEVVGRHYEVLSAPNKVKTKTLADYIKFVTEESDIKYEGSAVTKKGKVIPTEVSLNLGTYLDKKVYIIIEQDISQRVKYQEELKYREALFTELFRMTPLGVVTLGSNFKVLMSNKGFENIFGYSEEEIKGKELDKLIAINDDYFRARELSGALKAKEYIGVRKHKDGRDIQVRISAIPIYKGEEHMVTFGIYVDMTESIIAKQKLEKSLKEKEVLLSEIHHRVKNNLAIITGLLELQSYEIKNKEALQILSSSQTRINSIALVHEKLYMSDDLSEINMQNYINELISFIANTLQPDDIDINLSLDIDYIKLEINQALPCGLFLNEVITNSYKHAFKGKKKGNMCISFKEKNGNLTLVIQDDGIGFIEEEYDATNSLGMSLIETLADQLEGYIEKKNTPGAFIKLDFKKRTKVISEISG